MEVHTRSGVYAPHSTRVILLIAVGLVSALFAFASPSAAAILTPPVLKPSATKGDVAALVSNVVALLRADDWRRALTQAEAAARQHPRSGDALGLYALALARGGNIRAADEQVKRALALPAPPQYWALVAAGRMARWHRRFPEARAFLTEAVGLRPDEPDARLWLYYSSIEDSVEALNNARTYLSLAPSGYPHDLMLPGIRENIRAADARGSDPPASPTFEPVRPISSSDLKNIDKASANISIVRRIESGDGTIVFIAHIGDRRLRLMLDSGANGGMVLRDSVARALQLPARGRGEIRGVQGSAKTILYLASEMEVGPLRLRNVEINAVKDVPDTIDGVIGVDVLGGYRVTVDFDANTMTLSCGQPGPLPPEAVEISYLTPMYRKIMLPVQIGGEAVWATLDTGSSLTFLSRAVARRMSSVPPAVQLEDHVIDRQLGFGVTNTQLRFVGANKEVKLSLIGASKPLNHTLEFLVGGSFLDELMSPAYTFELGAILGIDFLRTFRQFTIDPNERKLILVPHTATNAQIKPDKGSSTGPTGPSSIIFEPDED